jgi:uncharacterized ion transporter superfamily protein YfcC
MDSYYDRLLSSDLEDEIAIFVDEGFLLWEHSSIEEQPSNKNVAETEEKEQKFYEDEENSTNESEKEKQIDLLNKVAFLLVI